MSQALHQEPGLWQADFPGGQTEPWEGLQGLCFPYPTPLSKGECVTWAPCPRSAGTDISSSPEERVLAAREHKEKGVGCQQMKMAGTPSGQQLQGWFELQLC